MNQHFNDFITDYEIGLEGNSVNIPFTIHPLTNDLSKIGKAINISKGIYTLIGGMSGSGKTSIADTMFVLNIFIWWKRNREHVNVQPYWIYRSMERSIKHKIAKWTCWLMYVEYGIIMDVPTILQWSNKKREITAEEKVIIRNYDKFFDELFQYVDIKQGAENPTGLYKYARNVAYQKGKYITSGNDGLFINGRKVADFNQEQFETNATGIKIPYLDIDIYGKQTRVYEYDIKYYPFNPFEVVFHVGDHVGKISEERGYNDKQILDKHYEYNGNLRDICAWNPVDIIQFNRAVEGHSRNRSYRKEAKETELTVSNQDFKGSGDGYENADLVLGLINPYKLNEMEYGGYKIDKFVGNNGENRFRAMTIVKNSYGVDDISFGYAFLGENGFISQLPNSAEMNRLNLYAEYVEAPRSLLLS